MRWFWRINYLLSVYFIGVVGLSFFDAAHTSSRLHDSIIMVTLNGAASFIGFFVDWIQLLLCLLVYLFSKTQRSHVHSLYVIFLAFSAVLKLLMLGVLQGFLGDM